VKSRDPVPPVSHLLVAPNIDNLGDRAAVRLDLLDKTLPVVDLDAKVMDGGPFAYQFCFLVVFAVIDHQREVYIAVR
jgi:hypothetical protein